MNQATTMGITAIIDYGSGNLRSAANAFERAARESGAVTTIAVTDYPRVVRGADRVVLPGVGAFADCRRGHLAGKSTIDADDLTCTKCLRLFQLIHV